MNSWFAMMGVAAALVTVAACTDADSAVTDVSVPLVQPPSTDGGAGTDAGAQPPGTPDAELEAKIAGVVSKTVPSQYPGVVVAVVDAKGRHVFPYGTIADGSSTPPNERTIFELGSVTKTFTGLMLGALVEDGKTSLDEPVAKLVPGHTIPSRGPQEITTVDLVTHFSGLPPVAIDLPRDWNERAKYSNAQMYRFLEGYTLARDIGAKFEYSNLGFGLLGDALATRAGKAYSDWIMERVCTPLAMSDTRVWLDDEQKSRAAHGRSATGARLDIEMSPDSSTIATGGLHSTALDMLSYLEAQLGIRHTVLDPALTRSHADHKALPNGDMMALAWAHRKDGSFDKGGVTGGFSSYVGFDPKRGVGVVVLTNATSDKTEDLGQSIFHLL